jgi:hypothetical protein
MTYGYFCCRSGALSHRCGSDPQDVQGPQGRKKFLRRKLRKLWTLPGKEIKKRDAGAHPVFYFTPKPFTHSFTWLSWMEPVKQQKKSWPWWTRPKRRSLKQKLSDFSH